MVTISLVMIPDVTVSTTAHMAEHMRFAVFLSFSKNRMFLFLSCRFGWAYKFLHYIAITPFAVNWHKKTVRVHPNGYFRLYLYIYIYKARSLFAKVPGLVCMRIFSENTDLTRFCRMVILKISSIEKEVMKIADYF